MCLVFGRINSLSTEYLEAECSLWMYLLLAIAMAVIGIYIYYVYTYIQRYFYCWEYKGDITENVKWNAYESIATPMTFTERIYESIGHANDFHRMNIWIHRPYQWVSLNIHVGSSYSKGWCFQYIECLSFFFLISGV